MRSKIPSAGQRHQWKPLGIVSGRADRTSSPVTQALFCFIKLPIVAFLVANIHSFLSYCFRKLTTCGFPENSLAMICRECHTSLLLSALGEYFWGWALTVKFFCKDILVKVGGRFLLESLLVQVLFCETRWKQLEISSVIWAIQGLEGCEGGEETAQKGVEPMIMRLLFWADTMWHCALEKYASEQTSRRFLACLLHSLRTRRWSRRSCPLAHPCWRSSAKWVSYDSF